MSEHTFEDPRSGHDAPWIDDPDAWCIEEVAASSLRPGWRCHAQETARFVMITGVSFVSGTRGRVVFVDLADGRTLGVEESARVWVRREIG